MGRRRTRINEVQTLPWTAPFALVDKTGWPKLAANTPIVYRLLADNGPISRAGGTDEKGILYIGESADGKARLNALHRGIIPTKPLKGHPIYWVFYDYDFEKRFPKQELSVELLHVEDKELAVLLERTLLEGYCRDYKDKPPLNSTLGNGASPDDWSFVELREWVRVNDTENRLYWA